MKRALLSLLLLAGCKPLQVEQGRYACDPNGNREVGSAQCPGNSRCGLEGYCHAVGEGAKWKCVDATDCENDWQCGIATDGVSRECHDPKAPEDHRCLSNDDCSGGWTCGLDVARLRRCHDPLKPKAWPCEATSDCVGGWQCGVAATGGRECHDPANPQAWVCLTNDDCLGGWQCGLNDLRTARECHDPNLPRSFACERDGDCLGGWRCGLNDARTARECHDPNMPRSFACERASDCLGGFVCGLNDARTAGECHDPNMPRSFACLTDADCVANWDCGLTSNRLQRECHDPQNPQAFACERDDDCLGGWRCDVDRRCVNPAQDALEPLPELDAGAAVVRSPGDRKPITQLAVSPVFGTTTGGDTSTVALVRDGRLEAMTRDPFGTFRRWEIPFSPAGPVLASGPRWIRDLPSFPDQERMETPYLYATGPDGGLFGFELLNDGGVNTAPVHQAAGGVLPRLSGLRHGLARLLADGGVPTGVDLPYLLGFSESPASYVVFDGPGRGYVRDIFTVNAPPSLVINRAGNTVFDVADWYWAAPVNSASASLECTFLVDRSGVWASRNDYSFEPVHSPAFGNAACARSGLQVQRFIGLDGQRAAVVATPWDGGSPQVAVWSLSRSFPGPADDLSQLWCTSWDDRPCDADDAIVYDVQLGPCAPCPTGALLDVNPIVTPGQPIELEARCGTPDAGAFTFYRVTAHPTASGRCINRLTIGASSLFAAPALVAAEQFAPGRVGFANGDGQAWVGPSALSAVSVRFDQAATGVVLLGAPSPRSVVVGDNTVGVLEPGLGLVASSRVTPTAIAVNEPAWAVLNDQVLSFANAGSLDEGQPLAVSSRALPSPQVLVRAVTREQVTVAVLSAGNQVWTAVVDDTTSPPRPPSPLAPRVATVGVISSLAIAATDADAGTTFVGYATTSNGVSRLIADTPTVWRAEDVPLPAALTPREVWFNNGRARVGFSDGTVFSLPSRVLLAPSLGESVEDYAQVCGRSVALTPRGLFELVGTAGAAVGHWQAIPLPAGFIGLSGGRLHVVGNELYVFTSSGDLAVVPLGTCR
ncbi:MAG: hypothetical protein JNM69_04180 [Archangium sp.]|nr:hypothetical protein [Archangium sp.]